MRRLPVKDSTKTNVWVGSRLLSKAINEICDWKLRPFGVSATQFSLLDIIGRMEPTTRATIARTQQLDKSTLTRNLKSIFAKGWAKEVPDQADGRSRPIALTMVGKDLLREASPAWLEAQADAEALIGREGSAAITRSANRVAGLLEVSDQASASTELKFLSRLRAY